MATKSLTKSYIHNPKKEPFIGLTVGQQLYKMAGKYPDKEMFVFCVDKERFTFMQMKTMSQQFAASLVTMGLKEGDTIAVWGANHSEWIIALYATIQLGILLVPMRLGFPHSTIVAIMNKLKCKAILLTRSPDNLLDMACECFPEMKRKTAEQFKSDSCPHLQFVIVKGKSASTVSSKKGVYSYDDFMTLGNENNISEVNKICKSLDIDDPCCIYFTSGSTGTPKPAVHTHHSVLNHALTGVFLRTDVSNFNCNWEPPNGKVMAETLQNERVTIGTTMIDQIYDLVHLSDVDSYDFSDLKLMGIGGSMIPIELRDGMNKISQYTTNCYGMTEILITHTSDPSDPPAKIAKAAVYPIDGLETKVVDEMGSIVPVETVGEILVRGYTTFKYYLADDEHTNEIRDSNGWVRTGDLGVMDQEGFITVKGRKKDIIIKEGDNLIPAELETVLYKHPKVLSSLVVGLPDERVGEEVCACIKVDRTNSPTEDEIKEYCKGKVFYLLVPKYVLFMDEIPTTPNGKGRWENHLNYGMSVLKNGNDIRLPNDYVKWT